MSFKLPFSIECDEHWRELLFFFLRSRRESIKRLEYDVNVIEKEGRKLNRELEKVSRLEIPTAIKANPDDVEVIYSELRSLRLECETSRLSPADSSSSSGVSSQQAQPSKSDYFKEKIARFEKASTGDDLCGGHSEDGDTGLSSLHSSSDEAAQRDEDEDEDDFGTLV